MIQTLARELFSKLFYVRRPVMASFIKSKFNSSSNRSQNQYLDPNLTQRVHPNSCDPTLAWEKLKVKQVVKRLALV